MICSSCSVVCLNYSVGSTLKLVVMLLTLQHLLLLDVLSLSHSRPSHRLEDVSSNTSAANCSGVNPLNPTAGKSLLPRSKLAPLLMFFRIWLQPEIWSHEFKNWTAISNWLESVHIRRFALKLAVWRPKILKLCNVFSACAVNALKSLYSEWSSKTPDIKDALPGWTTNISECSGPCESGWYGVYCDIGLEQHVVALWVHNQWPPASMELVLPAWPIILCRS